MGSTSYKECINISKKFVFFRENVVVFDVGCNINKTGNGSFLDDFTSTALAEFKNIEKVWAFEPVHWKRFEEIYKENSKVTLVKKALDSSTGIKHFYSFSAHGLSSLIPRKVFKNNYNKIEVESITIDDFAKENRIEHIDYLKVDTEGAELGILKGATTMLAEKKISVIQLEHGGTYADAGYTIEDVDKVLTSFGYVRRHKNKTEMLYTL